MEAAADVFNRVSVRVANQIADSGKPHIPIKKIISALKKTGSISDAAKIVGTSSQNVYKRLERQGLDFRKFTDYSDDKALSHEIIQYRIANGLTQTDIKKMPGGSKVLAICQLQDKISTLRDGKSANTGLQVIINLANKAHEIDVTPGK